MILELIISGQVIESIEVDYKDGDCYENNLERIYNVCEWLKYKYRGTIAIKSNWQIVAVKESKMKKK